MSEAGRPLGVSIIAILIIIGGIMMFLGGPVFAVLGIIYIIVGASLWTGKEWARKAAIILSVLAIITNAVSFNIVGIIINIIVIYYLTREHVKEYFLG